MPIEIAAVSLASASEDLCLAFLNTLCWRGRAAPVEALSSLPDLLRWLAGAAGLPARLLDPVRDWALGDSDAAAALFDEAIALREVSYRIFAAAACGEAAAEEDLAALNAALAAAPPRALLVRRDQSYGWAAPPLGTSVAALLAPVLWSAADLLARLDRVRIRRCANDECLWVFVDRSKGGTRRWCDMAACGNRAKARRHYLRTKPA